ncbi:MAG: hypothetical protein WAR24_01320, partial [Candidatus Acidiferrales bacterium]
EDFSEISNKSIWVLLKHLTAIVDVLKNELPFDYLTPSWHIEDATDNFTVGVSGRWGERYHSLMIYTHYLESTERCRAGSLVGQGNKMSRYQGVLHRRFADEKHGLFGFIKAGREDDEQNEN